jgi:hypothetical protein
MPRVAGHFCLVYLVNVFAILQIAQFFWGIARAIFVGVARGCAQKT